MSNNTKYLSYEGLSHYTDKLKGYFAVKDHTHKYLTLSGSTLTDDLVLKNSAAGDTPKLIFQRGEISSNLNKDTYIDYDIYNTEGKLTFSSHDKDSNSVGRKSTLFTFNRDTSTYTFYASFKTSVTIDAPTEDSDTPALIFKRGTFTDGWYDHKIYNSAGALKFQYSNAGTDIDILSLASTTSKLSSGLTLTGETSETARISFSRTNTSGTTWNYITAPVGGNIVIAPHGINTSSETGYHFGNKIFYPGTTNTYSLGTDTLNWKNVYATTLTGNLVCPGSTHPHIKGNGSQLSIGYGDESQLVFEPGAIRRKTTDTTTTIGSDDYPWKSIYSNGIIINGTDTDRAVLRFNNTKSTDESGTDNGVNRIGDYGFTFKYLGTGIGVENSLGLYADNSNATTQVLATKWNNDGTMYGRSILPHTNNTFDLGNSSYKWKNVYSVNFIENGEYLSTKYADKAYADYCASYLHSANRAQFCSPAGVTIEYSKNGGSTWLDYGATDEQKTGFFSGFHQAFYLGKKLSTKSTSSDMLRITMDATAMGFYTSCKCLLVNISTEGSSNFRVKVEKSMKGSVDTFSTLIESKTLTGWSGWNRIPIGAAFGGGTTQTYNIAKLRLTFMSDGAGSSYTSGAHPQVIDMEVLGTTYWAVPHTMAQTGHIYSWDYLGNAIFSKNVTAPTFIGNLTGNATSANETIETLYGVCTTAGNVTAKEVTLSSSTTLSSIPTGTRVSIKFNNTHTVDGMSLNINELGAITCLWCGTAIPANYIKAYNVYDFTYDGSNNYWRLLGGVDTNVDTKNTAGATDSSSKLFLIGATSQSANPQTYSHDTVYVDTNGVLNSTNKVKTGRVDFNDYAITNSSTQPNLFLAAIEPTSTTNLCTQKIFRFALTGQGTVDYGNCKINKQYAATNMWVAGDTFGYISMPYLESDKTNVYIGGGNRKGNSWSSKLLLDSDKITPDEIDDMFEVEFGIKF